MADSPRADNIVFRYLSEAHKLLEDPEARARVREAVELEQVHEEEEYGRRSTLPAELRN